MSLFKYIGSLCTRIYRMFRYIFKPGKCTDEEYSNLHKHLDKMLHNKGFEYASKIKDLIKKQKH